MIAGENFGCIRSLSTMKCVKATLGTSIGGKVLVEIHCLQRPDDRHRRGARARHTPNAIVVQKKKIDALANVGGGRNLLVGATAGSIKQTCIFWLKHGLTTFDNDRAKPWGQMMTKNKQHKGLYVCKNTRTITASSPFSGQQNNIRAPPCSNGGPHQRGYR